MIDTFTPTTAQGWTTIYDNPGKVKSNYITVDSYRTHYREAGSKASPPLVLVHGANIQVGLGSDRWFPNLIPLGEDFHVFAIDELGGGDTEPPRDINAIGHIRVRADHVLAFIEALGVGPVHLLGQSQGAWIAAYVALLRPDLVNELILVDSASLALPGGGVGFKESTRNTPMHSCRARWSGAGSKRRARACAAGCPP